MKEGLKGDATSDQGKISTSSIIMMDSCETDSYSSDESFPRQLLSPPCVDVPQLKPIGDAQKIDLCICVGLWSKWNKGWISPVVLVRLGRRCCGVCPLLFAYKR